MDLSTPKKPNFLSKFFDYTLDSSVSPTPLKNEQQQTINKNQYFSQAKTSQKIYTQNSQNQKKSPKNNQSESQEHNMFSLSSQQQQQQKFSQQQNFGDDDDNNNNDNQQSTLNQQQSEQIPLHLKTVNKYQQNYENLKNDIKIQDTQIKIQPENPTNFKNQDYNKVPQNFSQNQKNKEGQNLLYQISDQYEKCFSSSNSLNISEISDFIKDQNKEKQQNQQEKINLDQNSLKAQPSQNQVQILHQENQLNSIKFQASNYTPNQSDNFIDFSEIKSANNQESGKKSKKGGNYKELMDFQELVDLEQERKIYQINESDSLLTNFGKKQKQIYKSNQKKQYNK
ncbi:hypothetical protein PPERSA_11780 [Pseudocohnilembus persalinus]|uniref:Uncharacterized protein n=1 Tax=Pseudocohnilembus persalinus TaxID=266149 RepID=A0A0V0QGW2_PSEPJ|nr:hypothetical protein PPERSA_11780 [Pseudocohnilembus persalinus]|eukprot:KRX01333.1 hypothetical protein PPERSA_11780 [Pseudocohnilembus persalinus]